MLPVTLTSYYYMNYLSILVIVLLVYVAIDNLRNFVRNFIDTSLARIESFAIIFL